MDKFNESWFAQALLDPSAYPHRPSSVELIQTHISWVFLTGPYAYKIKKPVNFGFLDYTTLEKRRRFCRLEVELNRRLCPSIYLGVVPVTAEGGRYFVEGPGRAVDYAVKMVELPQERMMDVLLDEDSVISADLEEIARELASFHLGARTGGRVDKFGDPQIIAANVEENFEQTRPYIGVTITPRQYRELKKWSRDFLEGHRELFQKRILEGKIRDCHGDLHSKNICLTDRVYIYDCIEFNHRFRYGDVASEVAFLVMDLEFHRAGHLARAFLEKYLELTQDKDLPDLLNFYKIYRAYVRGKTNSFLSDECGVQNAEWKTDPGCHCERSEAISPLAHLETGLLRRFAPRNDIVLSPFHSALRTPHSALETAQNYFQLAHAYLRGYRRPMLLITAGLMGSGKTRLAYRLSREIGAQVISSDQVRKELAGAAPAESFPEAYERGIYSPDFSRRTYRELLNRADYWLLRGEAAIIDASFSKNEERLRAAQLAQKRGADFYILHCRCSPGELMKRLQQRWEQKLADGPAALNGQGVLNGAEVSEPRVSDGRPELLPYQRRDFEPFASLPPGCVLDLNTEEPEEQVLERVLSELSRESSVYASR